MTGGELPGMEKRPERNFSGVVKMTGGKMSTVKIVWDSISDEKIRK